jgi:hypothetical protein
MSLVIGAETIEVRQGTDSMGYEPLSPTGEVYDGTVLSAIVTARGYARVWGLTTPLMDMADVEALEAELAGPGAVTVTGELVDDSGISCHARNVRRVERSTDLLQAALAFELVESDPT